MDSFYNMTPAEKILDLELLQEEWIFSKEFVQGCKECLTLSESHIWLLENMTIEEQEEYLKLLTKE